MSEQRNFIKMLSLPNEVIVSLVNFFNEMRLTILIFATVLASLACLYMFSKYQNVGAGNPKHILSIFFALVVFFSNI